MIISMLIEIRFDRSGGVRAQTFEVLPTQIYIAGNSTESTVLMRANIIMAFAAIRMICAFYIFFLICIKILYRSVIGTHRIVTSVLNDVVQIILAVVPVVLGFGIQGKLNLDDLSLTESDYQQLGRDT